MKVFKFIVLFVYILGIIYLLPSTPATPDLLPSTRSAEAGDTWQHPDQKGFYSDLHRQEVLSQMQSKYSFSVLGVTIPSFRLNYRPEEAYTMVRDQTASSYLEEIVYPLRDSLFVNGWEPENAPAYAHLSKEMVPKLLYEGKAYYGKVTLKPNNSSVFARIAIWTLIFPATFFVLKSFKKSFTDNA